MGNLLAVRIRKHKATKGGKYFYYHADILAPTVASAMRAAVEQRVPNWRMVDDFNPGQPESFEFFEVLFKNWHRPEFPREPLPINPLHRWHRGEKRVIPSDDPNYDDTIYHYPKTRNLELEAKLKKTK